MDKALLILKDERLLLKNPEAFNDPFDFNVKRSKKDVAKVAKIMRSYLLTTYMVKATELPGIREALRRHPLYRTMKSEYNLLVKALKKFPYFDGNFGFTALYKIMGLKSQDFKKEVEKELTNFEQRADKELDKIKKQALVTCFGKKHDSILMWSHYSESHTGVCFEYDVPIDNDFVEVKYSKKRPKLELYKLVSFLSAKSIIGDQNRNDYSRDLMRSTLKPFVTKSICWKYEEEVRFLTLKTKRQLIKEKVNGEINYYLEMPLPTKIYIGCRAKGKLMNELIKIAKEKNIKYIFMKTDKEEFKLIQK